MASLSSKKTAQANAKTLKELHLLSLLVNSIALLCILVLKRPTSLRAYLFLSIPAFGCQYVLQRSSRPKYITESGRTRLVSSGNDIKGPGLFEYMFDTIYITWLCDILMAVFGSTKVWWLYAVVPVFFVFKVCSIARSFFGKQNADAPVAEAEPTKSKRQTKTEKKQKQKIKHVRMR